MEGGGRGRGRKGFLSILGCIDVGVCYTCRARSRRWCGWWGRRGRWGGGGGGVKCSRGMDGSRNYTIYIMLLITYGSTLEEVNRSERQNVRSQKVRKSLVQKKWNPYRTIEG